MVWYFINENNNIIFNHECQIYINKFINNHSYAYCALKEADKMYKEYGCILYIDFKIMKVYYENDIFKTYDLVNNDINEESTDLYVPTCSISDHYFPHHDKIFYVNNIYCPHKNPLCHDRFCKEHNIELISINFPFVKYNHNE
ncbi:unknown similar to AMEV211 [Mythimna separata entomopoxvirus 'L']|uniref:Uncharacterized protein n=1 Tax=Mythimna separata entomopoxvirus 'L' TaxID=1293572 RepID=A0A916KQD6_9POXV|nr:unknown similar to AMEV211 [Mythimna separata entomopoxvirus 'L']CCU56432.1 unknown similar to AMEV211 [Mythimna separata entomopoxvirus 'L']